MPRVTLEQIEKASDAIKIRDFNSMVEDYGFDYALNHFSTEYEIDGMRQEFESFLSSLSEDEYLTLNIYDYNEFVNNFVDKYRWLIGLIKNGNDLNKEILQESSDYLLSLIPGYSFVQNFNTGRKLLKKCATSLKIWYLKQSIEF